MKILKPPFFEVGPKAYSYGKEIVEIAELADQLSEEYNVRIIFTPQYVDIPLVAVATKNLFVFAQHMDSLPIGRGIGSVLPEAIKAAGADGVFLNHVEKRISSEELRKSIQRAKEVGLMTFICCDTLEDALINAKRSPNFVVVESPEMIGGEKKRDADEYKQIENMDKKIHEINKDIIIFHGAGIDGPQDVYDVISAGASATGSSSGIFLADDPKKMLKEMIQAVHEAWIFQKNKKEVNK